MKKMMMVGAVVVGLMAGCSNGEEFKITDSHGFKIVSDDNNNDNKTQIVATIKGQPDKDGYINAVNDYDKKDTVAIDKMNWKDGDRVLISFKNDSVIRVTKVK